MKISSKSIAVAAITLALTAVLAPLPFVFMLPLLFTCCTRGMKMSLFMGLAFGVVSFLYAFAGSTPVALAFIKAPYIAIIPRILVAFFACGAFKISKKLIKGNSKTALVAPYVISAAVGTLSNTVLVVSSMLALSTTVLADISVWAYVTVMITSGLIELAVSVILAPAVSISVEKALSGGFKKRAKAADAGVGDKTENSPN